MFKRSFIFESNLSQRLRASAPIEPRLSLSSLSNKPKISTTPLRQLPEPEPDLFEEHPLLQLHVRKATLFSGSRNNIPQSPKHYPKRDNSRIRATDTHKHQKAKRLLKPSVFSAERVINGSLYSSQDLPVWPRKSPLGNHNKLKLMSSEAQLGPV